MTEDNWVLEAKAKQERLLSIIQQRIELIVPLQHQADLIQTMRDLSQIAYSIGIIEGKEFVLSHWEETHGRR